MPKQTLLEAIGNLDLPPENREEILARAAKLPEPAQQALFEDLRTRLMEHAGNEMAIQRQGFEILGGVLNEALTEDTKEQKSVEQHERNADIAHAEENLQTSS